MTGQRVRHRGPRNGGLRDRNQDALVHALEQAGCTVQDLGAVGLGVPDLLVGYRRENHLLEVKTATGRLTDDQVRWHDDWRGRVVVVRTVDEALRAVGALR